MDAYERLLGDAMLFAREDGVEAAWAIVQPILGNLTPLQEYEPGSWGPPEAEKLNPTFPDKSGSACDWVSPWHFGLNEGPIVLMIENYRSGLVWQLMRQCPYVVTGLRRAGFRNGWLSEGPSGSRLALPLGSVSGARGP